MGRHETFPLREGWLFKGVNRMKSGDGAFTPDLGTADALGLGSRMAKSLAFWLEATGLGERRERDKKTSPIVASAAADAALRHDSYFEFPVSIWMAHLALARREASVWNWFFNDFRETSFSRETCVDAFARHLRDHASNNTTPSVMQREIACLLNTYAGRAAEGEEDPEDNALSPLRRLGLLSRHKDTGRFERTQPLDTVPLEAFLACVSAVARDREAPSLPLSDLLGARNGPARLFNLPGDRIDDLVGAAAETWPEDVSVSLLGAVRAIAIPDLPFVDWYRRHFVRLEAAA